MLEYSTAGEDGQPDILSGVSTGGELIEEQSLVKLFRVIELTFMRTNVVLNALLGRYSAFCPLNVASRKKERKINK